MSVDTHHALALPCEIGEGAWRVAIKDCLDIAGLPTRQGSLVLADVAPATVSAEVVEFLLADPRWRIIGKANMHEFAFGVTGVNMRMGTPINPGWPDRIPGGSSSGSAVAVASGLADMAIGTDTGGSVRMPATCCALVGFKPTYGLVSRKGAYPKASSLDCIGVLARDVAMIETAMTALAPGFRVLEPPKFPVIGIVPTQVDEDVALAMQAGLAHSAISTVPRDLPDLGAAFDAGMVIIGRESWVELKNYTMHPGMSDDIRARVTQGGTHLPDALAAAEDVRQRFTAEVDAALACVDALVLPALPCVPPTLAEVRDPRAVLPLTRLLRPFNLSGHPAITLPLKTTGGLPVAIQLVGRRGEDARLLALANRIRSAIAAESAGF